MCQRLLEMLQVSCNLEAILAQHVWPVTDSINWSAPVAIVVAPRTEHMTAPMQKAKPKPACAIGTSSSDVGRVFRSDSLSMPLRPRISSMVASPTYCPMVAALADPTTPQPATKTKNRSRLRLTRLPAALAMSGVLQMHTFFAFIMVLTHCSMILSQCVDMF